MGSETVGELRTALYGVQSCNSPCPGFQNRVKRCHGSSQT